MGIIPKFVDEGASVPAKAVGTTLANIWNLTIGNHVSLLVKKQEYKHKENLENYIQEIEKQTLLIPEENLVEPQLHIVGPALEASKYYIDSEELRSMFAKLVASSIDSRKTKSVHPSFIEIIKQLSPDEARIINYLGRNNYIPLINLHRTVPDGSGEATVYRNFSLIGEQANCIFIDLVPSYLDNLNRLGIINIPDGRYLTPQDEKYTPLEVHPTMVKLCAELKNKNLTPIFQRRYFFLTTFGTHFYETCI